MSEKEQASEGAEAEDILSTDIITAGGKAFKTSHIANLALRKKKLEGYKTVKVASGFVIRKIAAKEAPADDIADLVGSGEKAVAAEPELPVSAGVAQGIDSREKAEPRRMCRIIIHEQENWDKNQPVFVTDGETGKQYHIKRNFEVVVPIGLVNVLKESVIDRIEYDDQGNERVRSIPRFALNVLDENVVEEKAA